jgi:autotransporter-associated beta strand protein
MRTANAVCAFLSVILLAGRAHAVDFVFQYDDPAGFGFYDPTILPADTISVGERRRAALEAAGAIWGRLIRPAYFGEQITVRAKFDERDPSDLATAKPHFFYSDFGSSSPQYQGDTNYPKALANHLAGRDLAPQRPDIEITVNETVTNFYYRLDGMAGGQMDFVTVAAHELGHGLGFTDSFQEGGDYGVHGDGTYHPFCTECLPTPYDRFVTLGPLGPTLLSLPDDDARESALTSTNVFWNGASGIAGNGGAAPRIAAPATFDSGSSIAHLDATLGSLMVPSYPGVRQTISAIERGILRDLGWNISVTPSGVNWTGAGADNKASAAANWSTGVPLPGDSLSFGPSPRTEVDMDLTLYSIGSISFAADAPAYTLTFARQNSTDITAGITNLSSQTQKVVVANGFANSPDQRGATLTFKTGTSASNAAFEVLGGGTSIEHPPNLPPRYVHGAGGRIVFEGNARAGSASFTVGGGAGFEAPQGVVIFRGNASAGSARFHNKGGIYGVRLPGPPANASGYGGETRFEGNSNAGTTARFRNDGEGESIGGTGGITTFTDDASAGDATFESFGVPQGALFGALGGFTRFLKRSSANTADFINYEGATSNVNRGMGETQFWDDARAGSATFTNMGATLEGRVGGVTRFHDRSTGGNGTFTNLGGGFQAGGTEFYDDSNAGSGTFLFPFNPPGAPMPVGSGRTEFFDSSVASADVLPRAEYLFQGGAAANSLGGGGTVWFHDNSRAGLARFTFERFSKGIINFVGRSRADRAEFVMQDQSFGRIWFYRDSSASDRTYDITAGGNITFGHSATAAAATITIQNGASGTFGQPELATDVATAGNATIRVMGATLNTPPGVPIGGRLGFSPGSSAGSARITVEGGVGAGVTGARLAFTGGQFQQTTAGNATLTVNGGTNGGLGGTVVFQQGAKGGTARLVANAGGTFDFGDQRVFSGTEVGSIEGDGMFVLNGSHLTTGNRNSSTTVSGQITDGFGGVPGMLTKVGTGTLTLAGENTYTGLTTVAGGTLRVDGAIGDRRASACEERRQAGRQGPHPARAGSTSRRRFRPRRLARHDNHRRPDDEAWQHSRIRSRRNGAGPHCADRQRQHRSCRSTQPLAARRRADVRTNVCVVRRGRRHDHWRIRYGDRTHIQRPYTEYRSER